MPLRLLGLVRASGSHSRVVCQLSEQREAAVKNVLMVQNVFMSAEVLIYPFGLSISMKPQRVCIYFNSFNSLQDLK